MTADTDPGIDAFATARALVVRSYNQPRLVQHFGQIAAHSLEQASFVALAELNESSKRTDELAYAHPLDVSTVSRQVQRLIKLGFIRRAPVPDDNRGWSLSITDEGRSVLGR